LLSAIPTSELKRIGTQYLQEFLPRFLEQGVSERAERGLREEEVLVDTRS